MVKASVQVLSVDDAQAAVVYAVEIANGDQRHTAEVQLTFNERGKVNFVAVPKAFTEKQAHTFCELILRARDTAYQRTDDGDCDSQVFELAFTDGIAVLEIDGEKSRIRVH